MDYKDLLSLLKSRRSIHRFKPDPVPDDYILKIIEAARWAPSGMNSQPWEFVVVKEPAMRDQIVKYVEEDYAQAGRMEIARDPKYKSPLSDPYTASKEYDFTSAPVFILLFGDTRLKAAFPLVVQYTDHRNDTTFTCSLAYAFLYMHLAATSLGLASRWISAVQSPTVHCLIKDLLGIPPEMEVFDMMVLGYPALKPRQKLMRETTKMVHFGRCSREDFRTDDEVNDYIRKTRTWVTATHRRLADEDIIAHK
jgi:nitroreductase